MNVLRMVAVAMLATTLAGCANWNGIYRTKTVKRATAPQVITVDAKQREVLMIPDVENTGTPEKPKWVATGQWRVCAEAAPDVFSVLAASASGALKVDAASKSGELRAALAISESASTIERTQTINLLRESFYRTCERYMSGAINKSAFVVQAGRDSRAMIAILAIEQLTRAARPGPTVVIAGGTSATVTTPQDWVRAIETAQAEVRAADANVTAVADSTKSAREAKCDTGEADAIATCKKSKEAAETQLADASARAKDAHTRLDAVLAGAKNSGSAGGVDASTTIAPRLDAPSKEGERSESDLATVSADVRAIAEKALEPNEMQLFCIQKLADDDETDKEAKLIDACIELLSQSALFDAAKFTQARAAGRAETEILFDQFWKLVTAADGAVDKTALGNKVDAVTKGRPLPSRLKKRFDELKAATDRDGARSAFDGLSFDDKEKLAK